MPEYVDITKHFTYQTVQFVIESKAGVLHSTALKYF